MTAARVEGLVVRLAQHGFGVEWREFAHPAVLAILMVRQRRSELSAAKQDPRVIAKRKDALR
jgi:hypothetical protein